MSVLSKGNLRKMGQLEIRKCRRNEGTVLDMSEKELLPNRPVLFPSLKSMEINQCELEGMPSMVLVNAPNLSRLVLTDDKIKMVNRRDLEAQAKTVSSTYYNK